MREPRQWQQQPHPVPYTCPSSVWAWQAAAGIQVLGQGKGLDLRASGGELVSLSHAKPTGWGRPRGGWRQEGGVER